MRKKGKASNRKGVATARKKKETSAGLSLLRITVVEAKNLVISHNQTCRPFVSVRVGSQYGNTRVAGCFKWSGQQKEVTCEWKQSFCLVVRQEPIEEDLGDVLALRVMSYQMARKDICLGKADISVATLGNPMRPPQTGVILLRGERGCRRSSCGLNRGNLSQRMAQDFWVPLTVTNPISMQTIHAGEVRLRLLIQPVPPFHQYYEQFPHPRILYSDDDAHQQRTPRGTSGTGHEHFAVATLPVEAREETEEDRTMHEGLLRRFLRSVRHSAHGASPQSTSFLLTEHRIDPASSDTDTASTSCAPSGVDGSIYSRRQSSSRLCCDENGGTRDTGFETRSAPEEKLVLRVERRYGWEITAAHFPSFPSSVLASPPHVDTAASPLDDLFLSSKMPSRPDSAGLEYPMRGVVDDRGLFPNFDNHAGDTCSGKGTTDDDSDIAVTNREIAPVLRPASKQANNDSRVLNAVLDQMQCEQHRRLRESTTAPLWLQVSSFALRNPLPFGAWVSSSSSSSAIERDIPTDLGQTLGMPDTSSSGFTRSPAKVHNEVSQLPSSLEQSSKQRGSGESGSCTSVSGCSIRTAPAAFVAKMRALVLAGVPDTLRIGGNATAAFHSLPLSWLAQTKVQHARAYRRLGRRRLQWLRKKRSCRTPDEGEGCTEEEGHKTRATVDSCDVAGLPYEGCRHDGDNNSTCDSKGENSFGSTTAASGEKSIDSIISRLRVAVPRFHMVHDSSVSSFALYRIRVSVEETPVDSVYNFTTPCKDNVPQSGVRSSSSSFAYASSFSSSSPPPKLFSNGRRRVCATWEIIRRWSEFEALAAFLTDVSPGSLAGSGASKLKELGIASALSKSVRSLLRVTMTPEFLSERRGRLEESLRLLLEATKQPTAVCGYYGYSLSERGQIALLSFLGAPEALHPQPPAAVTLAHLFIDGSKELMAEDDSDAIEWVLAQQNWKDGASTSVCGGCVPSESRTFQVRPLPDPHGRMPTRVLYFRSYIWLLISGAARRLTTGRIFNNLPYSYERLAAVACEDDWVELVTRIHREFVAEQQSQQAADMPVPRMDPLVVDGPRPSLAAFRQARRGSSGERSSSVAGEHLNYSPRASSAAAGTAAELSSRAPRTLRSGTIITSYRLLSASFAQIELDVMRTKVKPLDPSMTSLADILLRDYTCAQRGVSRGSSDAYGNIADGDSGSVIDGSEDSGADDDRSSECDSDGDNEGYYENYESDFDEDEDDSFEEEFLGNGRSEKGFFDALLFGPDGESVGSESDSLVKAKKAALAAAQSGAGTRTGASARLYLSFVPGDEAAALRRILRAFVLTRPQVGYCQAMNYVALFLLRSTGRTDVRRREKPMSSTAASTAERWLEHIFERRQQQDVTSCSKGPRSILTLAWRQQRCVRRWLEGERLAFYLLVSLSEDVRCMPQPNS
jgi:hypothetical protein